jgi:hypothetical protein
VTASPIFLPGVDDDLNDLIRGLQKQLNDRRLRNELRLHFYDGKNAIRQVGSIIPPQYYRLGIVLGWSAKAVDLLARRCNLDGFSWADGDLADLGWDELNDENQISAEASSALIASLIHGPSFLINTLGDEAEDEPPALLHVKDALNATGVWNTRRRRLDNLLSITERDENGEPSGIALYLDGRTITAAREPEKGGRWVVTADDPHDYGMPAEVMAYRPRPGRPFGTSRISRAVMSLHEQALRTVVRMEAHGDIYAIPDLWVLGAEESLFKNADGSLKANWQVMMGRVKGVPDRQGESARDDNLDRVDVKQFPASSPQPHLMSLKQQAQLFAGETSVPLTSLGVADMGNPTSADSYIASREDLIGEAEGATDDWSRPLARATRRLLAMANGDPNLVGVLASVKPKWRSPLYLSRAAAADAGAKQIGAIPWLAETEVGLELLGLDEGQIERALAERRRTAGRDALIGLLGAAPPLPALPPAPAAPTTAEAPPQAPVIG